MANFFKKYTCHICDEAIQKKWDNFGLYFPSKIDVFFRWGGFFSRKVGNFPDMWAETYVSGLLVSYSFFCKIYPLVVLVVVLVVIHRF